MIKTHRHYPIASRHRIVAYTDCTIHAAHRQEAHGGIVHLDTCRCGAMRRTETNGRYYAVGPWEPTEPTEATATP